MTVSVIRIFSNTVNDKQLESEATISKIVNDSLALTIYECTYKIL